MNPTEELSIYGHDKKSDPRYTSVHGRVPRGVISYYSCCETKEPNCDLVAFRLPNGSSTEFLLGRIDGERPRQLWRRSTFGFVPAGIALLKLMATLPCTREPAGQHEWWTWKWGGEPTVAA